LGKLSFPPNKTNQGQQSSWRPSITIWCSWHYSMDSVFFTVSMDYGFYIHFRFRSQWNHHCIFRKAYLDHSSSALSYAYFL